MTSQVIALGGGGFSMEPDNSVLDRYILQQARSARPRICFLATASGDADGYIARFYDAFSGHACEPSHITLFSRTPDLRSHIAAQDVVYVGGGNTKSLLALWRDWGLDSILKDAYESGVVMAGVSAGAICWFEQGVTDSFAERLAVLDCLGFLKGSCCPHYDGEAERRPAFHTLLSEGAVLPGLALDDRAAVHFVDGELKRVITSKPLARVYKVAVLNGVVEEHTLECEHLPAILPR